MKNKLLFIGLVLFLASMVYGAFVTSGYDYGQNFENGYQFSGHPSKDNAKKWIQEIEAQAIAAGTTIDKSANYTAVDPNDVGRVIRVDTDAVVITLPAVGTGETYTIMNVAPDGTAAIHVDVNSSDKVLGGCGFVALDDGDKLTNTKATANQFDYVTLSYGTSAGWYITAKRGTWADGG